jgi:ADP-ribose pyrophosphatase YjhB (NUDIX family)
MQGRWCLAAIEPQGRVRRGKNSQPVLALPKGLVDRGENAEHAALREVREETGVEATVVAKLDDIKYIYVRSWGDRARVFKIVSFYLLLYRSGELGAIAPEMRKEVRSAVWIPLEEAPQRLTYRGEREMAERAQQYLKSHPEIERERDAPSRTR